jgi:alkanesulfonate monooxygenase SsuD/methylene tetrahydromethanopterin reductase-like flavin-dependent oxidoreductase (luciferase family)
MTTSSSARIGVLLPTRELAIVGDYSMAPLVDFAQQAEDLGFSSLWTGDSLFARPRLDPLIVLSTVAAVTRTVTVGTAALTAALRHPIIGASMIASLDQASRGRLVLGLGAGFPIPESADEFAAVGVPFEGRAGRLDETAALWRRAWGSRHGGETGFSGRHWQAERLDRLPGATTPAGPPLWLAGSDTPRVIERVAATYDGWMPFLPTAQAYATAWDAIRQRAASYGRPADAITPAFYATVNVNRDRDRARRELEEYVQGYYGRSLDLMSQIQAYGYGTAQECAEWLAGYVRAGARHIVIRVGTLDAAAQLKEIADALLPLTR